MLRVIDKLEKIGADGVRKELTEAGIGEETIAKILAFVEISGTTDEILQKLSALGIEDETFARGVFELSEVVRYMRSFRIPEENFAIDLTIARGLDYYTGTVYETMLNDYKKLGSVCSGGRYENLTGFYTDKKMPGIGISIGLTRLFSQLLDAGIISAENASLAKVLVIPMDASALPFALSTAASFRESGIATDVYLCEKGMKQNGVISLKNMREKGAQQTLTPEEAINLLK